ncbi:MAG: hypothetical protein M1814_004750 [Vezdaea aestivalis]|nr:MAG: hypothetical protein M1814_004750 [Vezdaea aestivalis]
MNDEHVSYRLPASQPVRVPAPSRPLTSEDERRSVLQAMGPSSFQEQHTEFSLVKVHTAKCDLCNKKNKSAMLRCTRCSRQICRTCLVEHGGDASHSSQEGSTTWNLKKAVEEHEAAKAKDKAKRDEQNLAKVRIKAKQESHESDPALGISNSPSDEEETRLTTQTKGKRRASEPSRGAAKKSRTSGPEAGDIMSIANFLDFTDKPTATKRTPTTTTGTRRASTSAGSVARSTRRYSASTLLDTAPTQRSRLAPSPLHQNEVQSEHNVARVGTVHAVAAQDGNNNEPGLAVEDVLAGTSRAQLFKDLASRLQNMAQESGSNGSSNINNNPRAANTSSEMDRMAEILRQIAAQENAKKP